MNDPERAEARIACRLRVIQTQIDEVEQHLSAGSVGMDMLIPLAEIRGQINSLMAEMLAGHIRVLLTGTDAQSSSPSLAADLVDLARAYLK